MTELTPGGDIRGSDRLPTEVWDDLDGPTDARRWGLGAQRGREAGPTEEVSPNVGLLHGEVHGTSLATTACARHEPTAAPAPLGLPARVASGIALLTSGITAAWVSRVPSTSRW
jgi:hypothetical protein